MLRRRFRLSLTLGAFATVLAMIAVDVADARGRISIGSRGSRTQSAPPATTTAPTTRPIERTVTPPASPGVIIVPRPVTQQPANPAATAPAATAAPRPAPQAAPAANANRPGFAGGLLGAGLFGLVLGAGLTGGLGSLASFVGLALQIAIIAGVGWALLGLLQGRDQPPVREPQPQRPPRNRTDFGLRNAAPR